MIKRLKRFLYLFHRWLGVVLCVWFALLFASGIIMMYVEYPELTEEERVWQLEPLRLHDVRLTTAAVSEYSGGGAFSSLKLAMVLGRPAYQYDVDGSLHTVFADNGEALTHLTPASALTAASHSGFVTDPAAMVHEGLIEMDQWTVSSALHSSRPLHRVALRDVTGTVLYVSDRNGQIVRDSNRNERFWNWLGSTIHWIYPWQFRQHAATWELVLTYLSLAGVLSVFSGAVIGWWRMRVKARYRNQSITPYQGWQKWHHLLGLGFLVFISTWIFSGLMSMLPWHLFDNHTSESEHTVRYYGGEIDRLDLFPGLDKLPVDHNTPLKEIEWRRLGDTRYLVLTYTASEKALVLPAEKSLPELITQQVPMLHSEATLTEQRGIESYDSWYYSHHNRFRPLPALEVRFNDAENSWYHIDMRTGAVVQRLTSTDRWARWLYNGLHSLDFALLFQYRPLWDITVIVLCLCGFAFSLTAVVIGWRRLIR